MKKEIMTQGQVKMLLELKQRFENRAQEIASFLSHVDKAFQGEVTVIDITSDSQVICVDSNLKAVYFPASYLSLAFDEIYKIHIEKEEKRRKELEEQEREQL